MPEEMVENWEADDAAENWEADDAAFGEAEDSAENIGERTRYRPGPRQQPSRFRPARGVPGVVLRGQDGKARNVKFPTNLTTTAETNRGLASQEVGRRALAERLDRLEARHRGQIKRDGTIAGAVTLGIGGGLTAYGLIKTVQQPNGFQLNAWSQRESTRIAAVVSASQLATSGARALINKQYTGGIVGTAADIFSAAQLATFAIGSFSTPATVQDVDTRTTSAQGFIAGTRVFDSRLGQLMTVIETSNGTKFFVPLSGPVTTTAQPSAPQQSPAQTQAMQALQQLAQVQQQAALALQQLAQAQPQATQVQQQAAQALQQLVQAQPQAAQALQQLAQAAQAMQTPALQQAPTQQTPVQQTPAQQTPTQQTPGQQSPKKESA